MLSFVPIQNVRITNATFLQLPICIQGMRWQEPAQAFQAGAVLGPVGQQEFIQHRSSPRKALNGHINWFATAIHNWGMVV